MSLVVLGVSHHRAPLSLLEAMSLDPQARGSLARTLVEGQHVAEVVVLSTCNRTEVYAEAHTFHGAVDEITAAVCAATGASRDDLRDHVYIHYEDRAVAHAFTVAAGLDRRPSAGLTRREGCGFLRAAKHLPYPLPPRSWAR